MPANNLPLRTLLRHASRLTSRSLLREQHAATIVGGCNGNGQKRRFWGRSRSAAQPSPTPQAQAHEAELRASITASLATPAADADTPATTSSSPSSALEPNHLAQDQDSTSAGGLDGQASTHIAVTIDGTPRLFDAVFLRDSCSCPSCVDPHSKQKLFQTSDIPLSLQGSARTVEDASKGPMLELSWTNDVPGSPPSHLTHHPLSWLRRVLNTEIELRAGVRADARVPWDKQTMTANNRWIDYADYMASDAVLHDALTHLHRYGLLFMRNVPESESSVVDIASRIGPLRDTFYGRTWDVRSKPRAENIAYTPHFLGLHMDLLYTSNPPHLQFLHSLRARAPRGESFFSDALHSAARLHALSPAHFRTLSSFPVTFHYHHPSAQHYHFTRRTIALHPSQTASDPSVPPRIAHVNWAPPFQAPFEARIGSSGSSALRSYLGAAKAFERILSADENLLEHRLEEGECVVFDNRRVLHARRAFEAQGGERWLRGAYVDDDVFFSRLRVLDERYGGGWEGEGVWREAGGR